jgi:hypothetical protein
MLNKFKKIEINFNIIDFRKMQCKIQKNKKIKDQGIKHNINVLAIFYNIYIYKNILTIWS